MPRKPRELIDGGIYHVFNRGNDRRNLFSQQTDYQYFLGRLSETGREELAVDIYHYCLMPNHFHLLLRIQEREDLSTLMHHLQLAYARYFKQTRCFCGHVFQERFRSFRIHEESYYLQCGRYIERNPVKAGLVEQAADYPYASSRFYVLGASDPLITVNPYFMQLGRSDSERRERYRQVLALDEPYGAVIDGALTKV